MGCELCPERTGRRAEARAQTVVRLALVGNPNTGKSTVFNGLTGLRQHTGNWPGKTVAVGQGEFSLDGRRAFICDLPGAYSLFASSCEEEMAWEALLLEPVDAVIDVVDATHLSRNLNFLFQLLDVTDRVVVDLNLMDEARAKGLRVDAAGLERELGVPVVPTVARAGRGVKELAQVALDVATGVRKTRPLGVRYDPDVEEAISHIQLSLQSAFPSLPASRFLALRVLLGDDGALRILRERAREGAGSFPAGRQMNGRS